jgi:hypothetical protein
MLLVYCSMSRWPKPRLLFRRRIVSSALLNGSPSCATPSSMTILPVQRSNTVQPTASRRQSKGSVIARPRCRATSPRCWSSTAAATDRTMPQLSFRPRPPCGDRGRAFSAPQRPDFPPASGPRLCAVRQSRQALDGHALFRSLRAARRGARGRHHRSTLKNPVAPHR